MLERAKNYLELNNLPLDEYQLRYMSWRVCGYDKYESANRSNVPVTMVDFWNEDEEFQQLERSVLGELRREFAEQVIHNAHIKNTLGIMHLDGNVIDKALDGLDDLSDNEISYLKTVRNQYNPQVRRFLGLDEVTRPGNWDEIMIRISRAKENPQGKIIEGEYKESSE